MPPVTRILVIRLSSIGDIVLTTPVLRALKTQLEGEVEIHYLVKKKFTSILEANPRITKIHTMEKTVQEVLPALEEIGFDYIIDLHRNIRSAVVKRKLKTLAFTFRKLNFRKWLWVNLRINSMPDLHVVDRYMETLKAFGVKDDGLGLEYYFPLGSELKTGSLPSSHTGNYIAFAIGGMHVGKKMSGEKIASLCKSISRPIVLIGGPEDKEEGDFIARSAGGHVFNAAGRFTLHESADCIRKSEMVITGDTGMMHIASAFGKKIISLWGCTVPGFGMYPYRPGEGSEILEPQGRKKRPCSKLGNKCKYGIDNRCINHIEDNDVLEAIGKL